MGTVGPFSWRRSASHSVSDSTPERSGNPVPTRFAVLRSQRVGSALVVDVRYPDCLNFEGRKVLVYEDAEAAARQLATGKADPHFAEVGVSPVARFRPTAAGWDMAVSFARTLKE